MDTPCRNVRPHENSFKEFVMRRETPANTIITLSLFIVIMSIVECLNDWNCVGLITDFSVPRENTCMLTALVSAKPTQR